MQWDNAFLCGQSGGLSGTSRPAAAQKKNTFYTLFFTGFSWPHGCGGRWGAAGPDRAPAAPRLPPSQNGGGRELRRALSWAAWGNGGAGLSFGHPAGRFMCQRALRGANSSTYKRAGWKKKEQTSHVFHSSRALSRSLTAGRALDMVEHRKKLACVDRVLIANCPGCCPPGSYCTQGSLWSRGWWFLTEMKWFVREMVTWRVSPQRLNMESLRLNLLMAMATSHHSPYRDPHLALEKLSKSKEIKTHCSQSLENTWSAKTFRHGPTWMKYVDNPGQFVCHLRWMSLWNTVCTCILGKVKLIKITLFEWLHHHRFLSDSKLKMHILNLPCCCW